MSKTGYLVNFNSLLLTFLTVKEIIRFVSLNKLLRHSNKHKDLLISINDYYYYHHQSHHHFYCKYYQSFIAVLITFNEHAITVIIIIIFLVCVYPFA